MKRMIDAEKFLDKLLYMGYMDEEKSEVEEVANSMTEDAYSKDEVIAMFTELKAEIEELPTNRTAITDSSGLICYGYSEYEPTAKDVSNIIQQKIDSLKENKDGANNYSTKY